MKSFRNFIALSLSMLSSAIMAQEVSVDVAKSRALDFLSSQSVGPKHVQGQGVSSDLSLAYTSKSAKKTCFYVFNVGEDDGFVIAGGDESAREILGYCDHGTFDYDKAPANFKWWLSQYTDQIANADVSAVAKAPRRAKASTSRAEIKPIVKTKWNQSEPFNNLIPTSGGNTFVTGCVATAMAQVMYTHKCPATNGTGSHTYNPKTYSSLELSADFENTTYEWSKMLTDYSDGYTAEQANAVATLMYHVGISVDMDYNTAASGGSGAYSEDIGPALVNYFGYDKSVRNEYRTYFTDEDWEDLVYKELSTGRPILYSGSSSNGGGHQFICDGYDSDLEMFTFNWGWGGYCDGSYPLTGTGALQPNGSGIGGAGTGSAYDQGQQIVINVMPENGGDESAHLAQVSSTNIYLSVDGTQYEDNYDFEAGTSTSASLYTSLYNISCFTTSFDYGVKATEQTTGITYYWTCRTGYSLEERQYYPSLALSFNLNDIKYNGVYDIRPLCRKAGLSSDKDWLEADLLTTEIIPTVTVTGATDPDPVDITFSIESNSVQVSRTLQIEHSSNYNGTITYSSNAENIATVDEYGLITGVSVGTAKITVSGTAEGNYKSTITELTIEVTELVKDDVEFSISDKSVKVGNTLQISWTEDYVGEVSFDLSKDGIVSVDEEGLITGLANGSVTITATALGNALYNETSQTFDITVYEEGIVLTEQPYFNNDNNTYEDDLVFYYSIKNASGTTSDAVIYWKAETDHYIYSGYFGYSSVSNGSELSGSHEFTFSDDLTADESYTVYLYTDEDRTEPFNYPSVTFIYRNKLEVNYGVSPSGYGTFILPFNAEKPDDMTLYSCNEVKNDVLTLVEVDGDIERNVPYIVLGTYDDSNTAPYSFVGPEAIDAKTPSFSNGYLVGAVAEEKVPLVVGDYILQYHEDEGTAFYQYTSDLAARNITQFRACLRMPSTTTFNSITIPGGGIEGIEAITTDSTRPAGIYTLDGKRLSAFQKGLNVIVLEDGAVQKVFVK